jgi:ACS family glucarate transporter-like MFS transporter
MAAPAVLDYESLAPSGSSAARYRFIGAATFAASLMYLDRMCMSQMVNAASFQHDLHLDKQHVGYILGIFFFAYALSQIPAGLLGDRFAARPLLTVLIAVWSGFTILAGFATGFWSLILARIGCGVAEAGAYPASAVLVCKSVPPRQRGLANGIIASGGRLGGAVAPWLTAIFIASLSSWRVPGWIYGGVGIVFALFFWVFTRARSRGNLRQQQGRAETTPDVGKDPGLPPTANMVKKSIAQDHPALLDYETPLSPGGFSWRA